MSSFSRLAFCALLVTALASCPASAQVVTITPASPPSTPPLPPPPPPPPPVPAIAIAGVLRIDAGRIVAQVSPTHAGLMTEEINHSYDGGLYGELIANRAFNEGLDSSDTLLPHWSLVRSGMASADVGLDTSESLSPAIPTSLRIHVTNASPGNRAGVANDGYWGIPVRPATSYRAVVYAKAEAGTAGPITLSIESRDGAQVFARAALDLVATGWNRYETVLVTAPGLTPTAEARLVVATEHPGTFRLASVSLFPPTFHDRPNGNRIDLMNKLAELRPTFLRFPGGNFLEGDTVATRFDWKRTLGDVTRRPGHLIPWGYRSSDGLGLLEFLEWCEDLGMEPVLAVYAGLSFHEEVAAGLPLQPFVQESLDEIEYVTGGPDTTWGARRAQDGHPAPFRLRYVEISNEDDRATYDVRFAQFHDAIKARWPQLQLIATSPVKSRIPDVLDEHFYLKADEFFHDVHHYDAHDRRGPKIFVGEWASIQTGYWGPVEGRPWEPIQGQPTPTLRAALGDAAWMTGMERNSDLIIMQAYAPLLANVNASPRAWQWVVNLIGYDALHSYGSPSYYAQKMFNARRGDAILAGTPDVAAGFFHSETLDTRTGTVFVKAVNSRPEPQTLQIEINGVLSVGPVGRQVVLGGTNLDDQNTLEHPEKIIPMETALPAIGPSFAHTFPPYSVTVLELPVR